MDASMVPEMESIKEGNRSLKKILAELSMQNELLKEALDRKCQRRSKNLPLGGTRPDQLSFKSALARDGQSGSMRVTRIAATFLPGTVLSDKLSPFISRMLTGCVRRSSSAPVSRSVSKVSVYSSKGKLLVMSIEPRS